MNLEDEVESAVRPPSGHEASQRPQCNGLSDDSSSETSTYSETSKATTVTPPAAASAASLLTADRLHLLSRCRRWEGLLR